MLAFLLSWQVYGVNELKLPVGYLGVLLIVFMAVMSISAFFSSFLAKRKVSAIKIISGSTFISAAGLLLAGLFPNLIIFVAGLILFEFGLGMESSSFGAWIQDLIPRSKRATFSSGLSSLKSLAGFFMALLLGVISEHMGYSLIWYLAALSLLISIAVLLYLNAMFLRAGTVQAEAEKATI
ncbi:Major Facilitator Superfamily protein [compost metagenome]